MGERGKNVLNKDVGCVNFREGNVNSVHARKLAKPKVTRVERYCVCDAFIKEYKGAYSPLCILT